MSAPAIGGIAGSTALPIVVVTAMAIKGERTKCIKSGSSHYIPKLVDREQLFSLRRVWLRGSCDGSILQRKTPPA
jgi:CheY-like chemotaxis protein